MPQKRIYVEEGIYFVTNRTFNFKKTFADKRACELFIGILDYCRKKYKFKLYAFAIMPDHVHLLILPRGKYNISDIMHRIKGNFAVKYINQQNHKGSVEGGGVGRQGEPLWFVDNHNIPTGEPSWFADNKHRQRIRMNAIWQKSFYDRIIRSDEQLYNTLEYINNNAVKHHLVNDPIKWPYSSYHNHCQTGKEMIDIDYINY